CVTGKLRHVDHFSSCKSILKFNNAGLIDLLVCLGGLVLGILSEVGVVRNRFLNPLNQTRALDPDALAQLDFESRVTRGGHGQASHRFSSSVGATKRPEGISPTRLRQIYGQTL